MKWKIVVVGKPALEYARLGVEEYLGRLRHYAKVEVVMLKSGRPAELEAKMLEASEGCLRVALDERGELIDTQQLVDQVNRWELQAVRSIALIVGGADGLGDRIREASDRVLALGKFTFQHELALVILLEQLYRAYTVQKGEPYHR